MSHKYCYISWIGILKKKKSFSYREIDEEIDKVTHKISSKNTNNMKHHFIT